MLHSKRDMSLHFVDVFSVVQPYTDDLRVIFVLGFLDMDEHPTLNLTLCHILPAWRGLAYTNCFEKHSLTM